MGHLCCCANRRPWSLAAISAHGRARATAAAGPDRPAEPQTSSRHRRLSPRCAPDTRCRSTTARAGEAQQRRLEQLGVESAASRVGSWAQRGARLAHALHGSRHGIAGVRLAERGAVLHGHPQHEPAAARTRPGRLAKEPSLTRGPHCVAAGLAPGYRHDASSLLSCLDRVLAGRSGVVASTTSGSIDARRRCGGGRRHEEAAPSWLISNRGGQETNSGVSPPVESIQAGVPVGDNQHRKEHSQWVSRTRSLERQNRWPAT
jgi:hypothetical protein